MKSNKRSIIRILTIVATCLVMCFTSFACTCEGCNGCSGCNDEIEYVEYGTYAQSLKAEDVTISGTADENGYFTGSDGAKYLMVTANPFTTGYTFSTSKKAVGGEKVKAGTTYYFKVEPIKWRVVAKNDDNMLLVCDTIIDTFDFCTCEDDVLNSLGQCANNYKESEIRGWLNSTFLSKAFTAEEIAGIHTVTVDNSIASTENFATGENPYVCDNTEDKVYLLSYTEVFNSKIIELGSRTRNLTDYARAIGCRMDDLGAGDWWLRSPSNVANNRVSVVRADGVESFEFVSTEGMGIVPVIQISNVNK